MGGNGSQQSWSNLETPRVMLTQTEQRLLPQPFHSPTGHTRRHLVAAILPFHLQPLPSDLQQTIDKEPLSEQHNLTTCSSEEMHINSFSLDWGSALNSSRVLGDSSGSVSLRISSDWFFRE